MPFVPAVRTSTVPTPADLFGKGRWSEDLQTDPDDLTGESGLPQQVLTDSEILIALLRCPLLLPVAECLRAAGVCAGSPYPEALMLALTAAASGAYDSENKLAAALAPNRRDAQPLWALIRRRGMQLHGWELPVRPPTIHQLRAFRERVERGALLPAMRAAFAAEAQKMARAMGSLQVRRRAHLDDLHPYNLLIGDGTIITAYSKVEKVTIDVRTGEVTFEFSTAKKRKPRVQTEISDTRKDNKPTRGINVVHIGTLTYTGYLILAFDRAPAAESTVSMNLLDEVLAALPAGAVEASVYDRAVTGWMVDYLLGRWGVPSVGKAVASTEKLDDRTEEQKAAREKVRQVAKDGKEAYAEAAHTTVRKMTKGQRAYAAAAAVKRAFRPDITKDPNLGLVPGVSIRQDSKGNIEVIESAFVRLAVARHSTGDGRECQHQIVVDDEILLTLDERGLKQGYPDLIEARATRGADGFDIDATWRIRCEHGDFDYQEQWTPGTRRESPSGSRSEREQALSKLRLVHSHHPVWHLIAGERNLSESWHSWYKRYALTWQRATSPSGDQQFLGYFGAAMCWNAMKWQRHQDHLAFEAELAADRAS